MPTGLMKKSFDDGKGFGFIGQFARREPDVPLVSMEQLRPPGPGARRMDAVKLMLGGASVKR